jgi:hypothetical protein
LCGKGSFMCQPDSCDQVPSYIGASCCEGLTRRPTNSSARAGYQSYFVIRF